MVRYLTAAGVEPFGEWFVGLRDRQAQARVRARLDRVGRGLFGDCEPVGEGVSELRIDWGPGYRVYFARAGVEIVLLRLGGDKRKQQTDIKTAKEYWHDYQERTKTQGKRPG
ncbi:MAG: addiction module protein [Betaproteobacteria bacterium RIFCSPLOWO2_02_FULL_63_19]|nr:MAG: addiction module protein [Betaproteobacteria bacterium RIFCSPLOWO2_02_FULL_63_19]